MVRAFGYIRVSTTHQVDDGVSLEAQEGRIRSWCLANGYDLAGLHVDAGLSGGRADNRPGLQAALDDVCSGGGLLIVYSLSRLARSVRDTLAIAERLDKAGADLASLSEKIDTTSASGRMLFKMLAVLADFERDLIAERTQSAMNFKRSKGERLGQIPLGQKLASDGRTLETDAAELVAVATIRELAGEGLGPSAIARELGRRGIRTKAGLDRWSHTSVTRVLARQPGTDSKSVASDTITAHAATAIPAPHLGASPDATLPGPSRALPEGRPTHRTGDAPGPSPALAGA
jgi:site-specific DNA recombinase